MYKHLLVLACSLSLSGCIGTAFLFDDEQDLSIPYPDLHCVPDKPPCPNMAIYKQTEEALSQGQSQAMEQNKQLRDQFKLETNTAKPPKDAD